MTRSVSNAEAVIPATPEARAPAFIRDGGGVAFQVRVFAPRIWHLSVEGRLNRAAVDLLDRYWREALVELAPPGPEPLHLILQGRLFRRLCAVLWSATAQSRPLHFWVVGRLGMCRWKAGGRNAALIRVSSWKDALTRALATGQDDGWLSGSPETAPSDEALGRLWRFMTDPSAPAARSDRLDPALLPLYQASARLKRDCAMMAQAKAAVERDLEHQNRVHKLRADIWQIAADKTLSADALIQKLLDKIGPFLRVSRACYNAFAETDTAKQHGLICTIEWCDQGIKPSLGTHIPPFLVKSLSDKPIFHITPESAASVVPAPVQGIVRRMIEAIILPLDVRSLSVLPHKIDDELEGCFTFDICRSNPHHLEMNDETRDVVQEMIDIINNHLVQRQAHAALRAAYDDLEDRVQARTADLARMNRELEQEIQERRQTEADLRQAKEAAEAANVAKSQFLANISHEIRTPLHAIMGYSEIILRSQSVTTIHEKARIVLRESGTLLRLIEDLLDQSRLDAGRLTLQSRPFDLHQMLNHVESSQSGFARQKGLAFSMSLAPDLPTHVLGDETRLRQVLNNLIHNAIKFTPAGRVTLRVAFRPDAEDGAAPSLRFEVEDTGVGIAQGQLDQIFQRFTQADGSMTRRFGGAGLGTTIARQLVGLMEGRMGVESEEGKGSLFWFEIPWTPVEVAPPEPRPMPPRARKENSRGRVLLVEDYPANQEVALMCLEDAGYEVDVASNGMEALEACSQRTYAVVLMDVQMPEMDGFAATRRLRMSKGRNAGVPVVGITAHAGTQDRLACLDAGMDDVVTKPLSHDLLLGAVNRWLGKRSDHGGKGRARRDLGAPSTEVLDTAVLEREFGPDRDYRPTVRRFISTVKEQMAVMRQALADEEMDRLRREAHALKGGAATLAAEPLRAAAEALERRAEKGGRGLSRALREVEARFRDLEQFMEGL